MTSEEFAARFQHHPLGYAFQNMERVESETEAERHMCMAIGMVTLLGFQEGITREEETFLVEAAQGNFLRNRERIRKTTTKATETKQ